MGSDSRTILHVDLDCFYAAVEVRDEPSLAGKPVAVGGSSRRGVLTTCNYEARAFGCRSAMPTFAALRLCPRLVVVPPRFEAYRRESARVRGIFRRFTRVVEPLSLDEAYLDVTGLRTGGASVAREIRRLVRSETGLTASAGIAPNKMLAKIASDWRKPDGQFEVRPEEVAGFVEGLPVAKLWGVGPKTAERLGQLRAETCGDLQRFSRVELAQHFGRFGAELYDLSRGRDGRPVVVDRTRKSLSNERTYREDLATLADCQRMLAQLLDDERDDLGARAADRAVHKLFVKLRFADFTQTTVERVARDGFEERPFSALLEEAWSRGGGRPVRLIGVGVRFADEPEAGTADQMELGL